MGLLEVVPGSHRRGAIEFRPNDKGNNNPFRPETDWSESDFIPIELADDAAVIFSQYLLHRSGFNRSPHTRLSVQLRYNDLTTMERAETSYSVQHSDYVLRQQKLLLRAK
jgi:ectoine hydroxylase-related dioxygenase (phytanoyl-CoA dioxygenase family)